MPPTMYWAAWRVLLGYRLALAATRRALADQ
jgi:hypothetical protein